MHLSHQQNPKKVFEILSLTKKGYGVGTFIEDYYSQYKGLLDELELYHQLTADITEICHQCKELQLLQFLVGLPPSFVGVVNQILESNPLSTLKDALKCIQRLPSITTTGSGNNEAHDASALNAGSSTRGCGHGRGRMIGGLDVGVVMQPPIPTIATSVDVPIILKTCWAKHGILVWANQATIVALQTTTVVVSSSNALTVDWLHVEFEHLMQDMLSTFTSSAPKVGSSALLTAHNTW